MVLPSRVLSSLIDQPFGAFPEEEFLNLKSIPRTKEIKLENVTMFDASLDPPQPVGLDSTDWILPPTALSNQDQDTMRSDHIEVFGILTIESLDWISEKGKVALRNLVRARDDEKRPPDHPPNNLTLEYFYSGRQEPAYLKIWLCFRKNMNALMDLKYWERLGQTRVIMNSKSRSYIVERFHPEQKRLSMLWFRRYYLWHTMRDIVDDDKKDNQPYHTPIQHRTIDWFIEQYRRRSSEQESARAPRHMPRYLDDTDLRGMFADHCEWLLGTQIATFSSTIQLFNTSNWVDFCKKVQWSRRESAQDQSRGTKRIWGVARGSSLEDFSKDDPFGLERFGGTKEEWRKKLRDALNREAKALEKPKVQIPKPAFNVPKTQRNSKRTLRATIEYDPDFDEASSSDESRDEMDDDEVHFIPAFLMDNPNVSDPTRTRWRCPDPSCGFAIEDMHQIPLMTRELMVEEHYISHLPAGYSVSNRHGNDCLTLQRVGSHSELGQERPEQGKRIKVEAQ